MIEKIENCLYCGSKMESITAKKRFCSDQHRVYYNREKKKKDEVLQSKKGSSFLNTEIYEPKGKVELNNIGSNLPDLSQDEGAILTYNEILKLAKDGSVREVVLKEMQRNTNLNANQKNMIICKIKK